MSKKTLIGFILLLLILIPINFFSIIVPRPITKFEIDPYNANGNTESPKSSTKKISLIQNYTGSTGDINSVISGDGKYIVIATGYTGIGDIGNVTLFNNTSTKQMWNYTVPADSLSAKICTNGSFIVVMLEDGSNGNDKTVLLFNNSLSNQKTPLWNYTLIDKVISIDISGQGKYIVMGGNDQNVTVLDNIYAKNNKKKNWTYNVSQDITSVAISADGKYVAAAHGTNMTLFDNTLGIPVWTYNTTEQVNDVDISNDGRYIIISHLDNITYLDSTQKLKLWGFNATAGAINFIQMSGNGEYIITNVNNGFKAGPRYTGLLDNSIEFPKNILWQYPLTGEGYIDPSCQKISDDGNYIIVGNQKGSSGDFITLLDKSPSTDKEPIWEYELPAQIETVDISESGDYFLAGCGNGEIYLFHHYETISNNSDDDDDDDDDADDLLVPVIITVVIISIIAGIALIYILMKR